MNLKTTTSTSWLLSIYTVAQFKNENVKLRHFYKTGFKKLILTFMMTFGSVFISFAQNPIWTFPPSYHSFQSQSNILLPAPLSPFGYNGDPANFFTNSFPKADGNPWFFIGQCC